MNSPANSPPDAELLLEHAAWIRRLARTLVRDGDRAEELAQETWLRLLERTPRLDRPFRGWIATVMRNLVRVEHRGARRRDERERARARPEAEPSHLELLERATLQRELVQAVLELDDPYRTTILLRYLEERTPLEIARRQGVPVATVKTRLARGLARLRERLGHRHPDSGTSLLAALADIHGPSPAPRWLPFTLGTLLVKPNLLVPLLLLALAGASYLWLGRGDARAEDPGRSVVPAARSAELAAPPTVPGATAAPVLAARESTPPSAALPTAERSAASALPGLHGRVVDADGAPVGEVAIALHPTESLPLVIPVADPTQIVAHTKGDGSFELDRIRSGRLFVRDERWTTLLAGIPVEARSGQESLVVAAPRIALAGIVVDESGAPLEGARVSLVPPGSLRSRLSRVLDFSAEVSWIATTDVRGRFDLPEAPAVAEGQLRAELDGYRTGLEPAPERARADLVLVLARPTPRSNRLQGRVVDPTGAPVAEALVSYGIDTARTDEEGRFSFQLDDPQSLNRMAAEFLTVADDRLVAVKQGFLPSELRAPGRDASGPLWPESILLRLGSEPLSIRGRVVDPEGNALAGVRVWVADPTFFGGMSDSARPERGPQFVQVEALASGAGPGWTWSESDAQGRFLLSGLTPRDYVVAAMDPRTLLRVETPAVSAGRRDVVLTLPLGEVFAVLTGRVVDSRGEPVQKAVVFPMCDALETRLAGEVIATQHEAAEATTTDAEGVFVLERVPRDLVYLRIECADTLPLEWGRGVPGGLAKLVGQRPDEFVIEVERRCHFQVELALAQEADEIGVLDAAGHELVISEFFGNGRRDTERHPLTQGRSSTLASSDHAATLVLYRAGSEVRRVALHLTPGAPTIVRP